MRTAQCWDDGVVDDIRLCEIIRRHGAKATFNLNWGLHGQQRGGTWKYRGKEVHRLAKSELAGVYKGFLVGNHSLTHPDLPKLSADAARREIRENKDALEQHFGQPVTGFAYPGGAYNEAVGKIIAEEGHVYARTVENRNPSFPPVNPMAFHPNRHFNATDFWEELEKVKAVDGVFYFWGHSYEIMTDDDWLAFEKKIERICREPSATWGNLPDLFVSR